MTNRLIMISRSLYPQVGKRSAETTYEEYHARGGAVETSYIFHHKRIRK